MAVDYRPKSVMITGGCGFLGSSLLNELFSKWDTCTFVNYDKLLPGSNGCHVDAAVRNSTRYNLVIGDVVNRQLVQQTLHTYKIDTIINCVEDEQANRQEPNATLSARNTVSSLTHFLQVCRHHDQLQMFLQISNDQVYGNNGMIEQTEDNMLRPVNMSGANAMACEAMLNAYRVSYKVPVLVVRIGQVFGSRQHSSQLIPKFIQQAANGSAIEINGEVTEMTCFMFVKDFCRGIALLIEKGKIGEIYNLAAQEPYEMNKVAKMVHDEVEKQMNAKDKMELSIVSIPSEGVSLYPTLLSVQKFQTLTGWKCETTLENGLRETVSWYLKPEIHKQSEKILIYGGKGWIGNQFVQLCHEKKVDIVLSETRPGDDKDEHVQAEIVKIGPSHVISFLGRTHGPGCNTIEYLEGGPDKLCLNARDNLYAPWILATLCRKLGLHMTYIGTGCLFQYNQEHDIDCQGYTEEDEPNYFGNSYSVVKGYTDRIMHGFDNVFNARIRLPINFELDKRNLVAKIVSYNQVIDIPNSVTILPDILPIVLDLMRDRYCGTLNMVNPGPIRHNHTLAAFKQLVDPNKSWDIIGEEDPRMEKMLASRANCALDTSKLQEMYPDLRSGSDGILEAVKQIGAKIKLEANRNETAANA